MDRRTWGGHQGGIWGGPRGALGRNGFGNQKSGRNAQDGSTDDELLCSRKKQPATMRVGVLVARGGAASVSGPPLIVPEPASRLVDFQV